MDTPTLTAYYREHEPMKRKELLEQSIREQEDPEGNEIRREIWEIRYKERSQVEPQSRADGYLALWMVMQFNRDAAKKFFGPKSAQKEIQKQVEKLQFKELKAKGPRHEELLYQECCHLVRTYMELCQQDRNYNSALCGLITISDNKSRDKLKTDIYRTAIALPSSIGMEEELGMITRAAKEMYELQFPGEGWPE